MMTEVQWNWLVAQTGDVDRADAEDAYLRHGNVRDAAVEIIRRKRNALLEDPLSVTIPGVVATSAAENIRAYERIVAALLTAPPDPTAADAPDEATDILTIIPVQGTWSRTRRTRGYPGRIFHGL